MWYYGTVTCRIIGGDDRNKRYALTVTGYVGAMARVNLEGMPMIRSYLIAAAALTASIPVSHAGQPRSPVIVHAAFGGQILGYDVDQNGSEGMLSEWILSGNGDQIIIAIETFDQKTGKVRIVKKIEQPDYAGDFITLGVLGTSIGVVERQYSDPYIYKTTYDLLDPLDGNKISGQWKPGLREIDNHIQEMSESQGSSTTAVLGVRLKTEESFVFGADVATNTSGPITRLTDNAFGYSNYPLMAFDTITGQAVVAAGGGGLTGTTEVGIVDVAKGGYREFSGLGVGEVNGIAVDSADGIACTATEADWNIQFYDIATESGFEETIQGGTSDLNSGADVEFDPVNKLFLIDQQVCGGQEENSCIQIYDTSGNWVETANGNGFSHMALNPNTRTGFLELNDNDKFDELQSFTY